MRLNVHFIMFVNNNIILLSNNCVHRVLQSLNSQINGRVIPINHAHKYNASFERNDTSQNPRNYIYIYI